MRRSITLFLVLAAAGSLAASVCPDKCTCKPSKRGSMAADCSFQNHTTAPGRFLTSPDRLDISGNQFPVLRAYFFAAHGLAQTSAIVLRGCKIAMIRSNSFQGLPSLKRLDLSFNNLRFVTPAMFPRGLLVLDVRGNNDLDCRMLKKKFATAAPRLRFLCSRQARRAAVEA